MKTTAYPDNLFYTILIKLIVHLRQMGLELEPTPNNAADDVDRTLKKNSFFLTLTLEAQNEIINFQRANKVLQNTFSYNPIKHYDALRSIWGEKLPFPSLAELATYQYKYVNNNGELIQTDKEKLPTELWEWLLNFEKLYPLGGITPAQQRIKNILRSKKIENLYKNPFMLLTQSISAKNNDEVQQLWKDATMKLIHWAIVIGDLDLITQVIELDAGKINTFAYDLKPIHFACALHDNINIVKILIAKGANLSDLTVDGLTPLFLAAEYNNSTIAAYLLENGFQKILNQSNGSQHLSALHIACRNGAIEVVRLFLEKNARLFHDKDGRTPLHLASANNHVKIVELLVNKYGKVNVRDYLGHTPLNYACKNGNLETVELLILKGADVTAASKYGETSISLTKSKDPLRQKEIKDALKKSNPEEIAYVSRLHRNIKAIKYFCSFGVPTMTFFCVGGASLYGFLTSDLALFIDIIFAISMGLGSAAGLRKLAMKYLAKPLQNHWMKMIVQISKESYVKQDETKDHTTFKYLKAEMQTDKELQSEVTEFENEFEEVEVLNETVSSQDMENIFKKSDSSEGSDSEPELENLTILTMK
jgi:ankyrin repeat protein